MLFPFRASLSGGEEKLEHLSVFRAKRGAAAYREKFREDVDELDGDDVPDARDGYLASGPSGGTVRELNAISSGRKAAACRTSAPGIRKTL